MDTPPARKRGFKLEFSGDNVSGDSIRGKFQLLEQITDERLTNTEVLTKALDFWLSHNLEIADDNTVSTDSQLPPSYQKCDKENADQTLFLCSESSTDNLIQTVESHSRKCSHNLTKDVCMRGGVVILKVSCVKGHALHT